jgi:glycosyltransferase involved in cell wall biosynthesis
MQYSVENKIDTILMVDIPLNALFFIKRLAKKNNIKIIYDSVEWYSPEQFKLRRLTPEYILNDLYHRIFIDRSFKVTAISKYLENHFKSRKIETVRIPVIMDVKNFRFEKYTKKDKLTILYAGSPGKKDYLKEIIELRLIGVTREHISGESDIDEETLNKIKDNIKVLGRVPREIVLENLKQADFTVLLRSPVQRYAQAGFPTKVVESLASATPVILNITSDLGDYITDMEQGLIVADCSSLAFCESLRRAINLTYEQRCEMYTKARECAAEYFNYDKYEQILSRII